MRFLCISILCAQVAYSSSVLAPNIWTRTNSKPNENSLTMRDTLYTVYPVNVNDADQVNETESFLKKEYGAEDIIIDKADGRVVHWRITLKEGDSTDRLNQYPGLRVVEPTAHQSGLVNKAKRAEYDPLSTYRAWALNPDNTEQTAEIFELLKSKTMYPEKIHQYRLKGKVVGWSRLGLSDEDKAAIEKHPGIDKPLRRNEPLRKDLVASEIRQPGATQSVYESSLSAATKRKRAVTWTKQEQAVKDLRMVSQPNDMELDRMEDFVYDSKAGEGIYVYVIDTGVQVKVINEDGNKEFTTETLRLPDGTEFTHVLQTEDSESEHPDPEQDDDDIPGTPKTHGTLVASKAVGAKYGVAKKATLVSVKMENDINDLFEAFELITTDLTTNEGRAERAVVLFSLSGGNVMTHDTAHADKDGQILLGYISDIIDLGTPVLTSAGNLRNEEQHKVIDAVPQVLEDETFHIINVGAVDFEGKLWAHSQDGTQVTAYAPGSRVEGQTKADKVSLIDDGTSLSTPMVAGLIATYMSSDNPPWDISLTGRSRVEAIKKFIKSSEKTAWVREGSDKRVIWNGATKDDHKSVGANTCASPSSRIKRDEICGPGSEPPKTEEPPKEPAPKCNDFGPNRKNYVDQKMVLGYLDDFCSQAAKQGSLDKDSNSIFRVFNKDAVEEIQVAMDFGSNPNFKPDENMCKHYMKDRLVGECDSDNNDFASGGEVTIGDIKYRWHAPKDRAQPLDKFKKWATCYKKYKPLFDYYDVYGAGFEGENFGNELHQNIKGKGIAVTAWTFDYVGGGDGREWWATFQTPIGLNKQVEKSIEQVGKVDTSC